MTYVLALLKFMVPSVMAELVEMVWVPLMALKKSASTPGPLGVPLVQLAVVFQVLEPDVLH